MPLEDRPREKLLKYGSDKLTDAELLAIVLRTGLKGMNVVDLSKTILMKHKNLAKIAELSPEALKKINGIGNDKAATLLAIFEISRRILSQKKVLSEIKFTHPKDIADHFIPLLRDEQREKFLILCLNSANMITRAEELSSGNLNGTVAHPREIYKVALDYRAVKIIIMHNHPSGNPEPSKEDINLTKLVSQAGKTLDIPLLDHIIIAGTSYCSLAEKGYL